ncbi:hypothetical protein RIF29_25503 [Crotalaria pallida]|uniref:Uncharacterized protein n=1 Tax=Crotalaria pallida TaxID=3830 RepID=A0AAN9EMJ0_CROPI
MTDSLSLSLSKAILVAAACSFLLPSHLSRDSHFHPFLCFSLSSLNSFTHSLIFFLLPTPFFLFLSLSFSLLSFFQTSKVQTLGFFNLPRRSSVIGLLSHVLSFGVIDFSFTPFLSYAFGFVSGVDALFCCQ